MLTGAGVYNEGAGRRAETIICVWENNNMERTQAPNATTKRYHKTLPQNATSNGGDASRVGKVAMFIH